ncbi:hypothetical protein AVEN_239894-1, partial [Araneus ventricosus]
MDERFGPVTWIPRSPYLSPLGFFWGALKAIMYKSSIFWYGSSDTNCHSCCYDPRKA